jgi:hypothetical protein
VPLEFLALVGFERVQRVGRYQVVELLVHLGFR